MTIEDIKIKYYEIEGLPVSEQCLSYNNEELEDWLLVEDYDIPNNSIIRLTPIFRGGFNLSSGICFNAMKQEEHNYLRKSGPKWREISKGLSTRGICKNKICAVFNQHIYKTLGFGEFDLRNMIENLAICPMCSEISECKNVVFFEATWYYKGVLIDGTKISTKNNPGYTQEKKYCTFKDGDNQTYQYLRFYVGQLK